MSGPAPGHVPLNQITISTIHVNTEQTLVQITEDKLRLVLLEHLSRVEAKRRWQVPLGVLLALIPVLLTSEFKDVAFVEKATWKAFFMFASIGAVIWLAATLRTAFGSASLDQLVERIKNVANP